MFKLKSQNINEDIHRFISNPIEFRNLLKSTETYLTGSLVLQMINDEMYRKCDMDIIVHPDNVNTITGGAG